MSMLRDVPVQFEGGPGVTTLDFLMNTAGEEGEGLLVPQELLRRGWAMVLDLAQQELRFEPEEEALRRLGEGASAREMDFSGCFSEGPFNRTHRVVPATVNGVPAKMLIDTGAEVTALTRNNPAIPSMLSAVGRRGATGGIMSTGHNLVLDDVPIGFAGTSFVLPVVVLPSSLPCWQGVLGTDVLRHCTVVWGWSNLWVACRAPGDGARLGVVDRP
jgi:hypothetical protein